MSYRRPVFLAALLITALLAIASTAQDSRPVSSDETAIEAVIQSSYVEGLYQKRDAELIRAGFAPTFVMQVYWDNKLSSRTLDEWLGRMNLDGTPSPKNWTGTVRVLEVTGVAAVARIDLYLDDDHRFTDYFGLYKTEDDWKIVTKHFHAHYPH